MNPIPETEDMNKYLRSSEIIDFEDKNIQKTANELSKGIDDEIQLIKNVYEFVRDCVSHSLDIQSDAVIYIASDVLKYEKGLCFGKSHLLAAILRRLNIPTGFCYQKLEFDQGFGLHGLNAVYIHSIDRWIRLDARGNKEVINAQFSFEKENLAYSPNKEKEEFNFQAIYSYPNKKVIEILKNSKNLNDALKKVIETDWLTYLE